MTDPAGTQRLSCPQAESLFLSETKGKVKLGYRLIVVLRPCSRHDFWLETVLNRSKGPLMLSFRLKHCRFLTGPAALTYSELASELSEALGRPINHVSLAPSELKQGMLAVGMPDELADRMLDLERYFREDGASRITGDIKQVTGQDPIPFRQYVRGAAATGVWNPEEVTG